MFKTTTLKNHNGNAIIWIVNFDFWNKFITCKISINTHNLMQFDYVSKVLTHSKAMGWIIFFSNVNSPYQMCTIPFQNWKKILLLMIKTSKGVGNFGESQFYNTVEHLWVKYVFGLKNHDFKSCTIF